MIIYPKSTVNTTKNEVNQLWISSTPRMRLKATDERGFPVPLDVPRDPLTVRSTVWSRHILILIDICPIKSEYYTSTFFCLLVQPTSCLRTRSARVAESGMWLHQGLEHISKLIPDPHTLGYRVQLFIKPQHRLQKGGLYARKSVYYMLYKNKKEQIKL